MRKVLFEFEDLEWLPCCIRDGMTDFLQFLLTTLNFYKPVIPLLLQALDETGEKRILDLCSGGGGSILQIQEGIKKNSKRDIKLILTDKFPNLDKYKFMHEVTNGSVCFRKKPTDACKVPSHMKGLRTMFSASHHFSPEVLKKVLKDSVSNSKGIAIFDGGSKSIILILALLLTFPFLFLIITPFIKPFKSSRIVFTYLIPLIPLFTIWDGIVSILRLYSKEQFLEMAEEVSTGQQFKWQAGQVKNKFGLKISYLIGYPDNALKGHVDVSQQQIFQYSFVCKEF